MSEHSPLALGKGVWHKTKKSRRQLQLRRNFWAKRGAVDGLWSHGVWILATQGDELDCLNSFPSEKKKKTGGERREGPKGGQRYSPKQKKKGYKAQNHTKKREKKS